MGNFRQPKRKGWEMSNAEGRRELNIKDFLHPASMMTPGLLGALTMMITNAFTYNIGGPPSWIALGLSFLCGTLVWITGVSTFQKWVFYILNSLIIFSVAAGTSGFAEQATKTAYFGVSRAYALSLSTGPRYDPETQEVQTLGVLDHQMRGIQVQSEKSINATEKSVPVEILNIAQKEPDKPVRTINSKAKASQAVEAAKQELEAATREGEAAKREAEDASRKAEAAKWSAEVLRLKAAAVEKEAEAAKRQAEAAKAEAETAPEPEATKRALEASRLEVEASKRMLEAVKLQLEAATREGKAAKRQAEAAKQEKKAVTRKVLSERKLTIRKATADKMRFFRRWF